MISLGCPKTLVDSEVILGKLDPAQYQITNQANGCDVVLLNTCSFIHDAQKESVDHILQLVEMKKQKKIKSLVVMGCLVQEFSGDLQKELKEVDAFLGSSDYGKIPQVIEKVTHGTKVFAVGDPGYLSTAKEHRIALTPKHYRYVKISEGCDHICSFCTIPSFRGKHRSRTLEDVVAESKNLVQGGAKEIILTGQDTSYFGKDYSGEYLLAKLLKELDQKSGAEWIRLLYLYPSCVSQELIHAIRDSERVCKYVDMPLQHASDAMLQAMRRGITKRRTYDLIDKFRSAMSDFAFRTTFIVGFPGETDQDFKELLQMIRDQEFDRVGIFKFSKEENSHAALLPDQVSDKVKDERWHEAMAVQREISEKKMKRQLGKTLKVLIEAPSQKEKNVWVGRSEMDAPDIDGCVFVHSKSPLTIGEFCQVTIQETRAYDLVGISRTTA